MYFLNEKNDIPNYKKSSSLKGTAKFSKQEKNGCEKATTIKYFPCRVH